MPVDLTKGRIALIPKKGDGSDFSHWRPITILNYSYRILSGVLAQKIEPILNNKIGFQKRKIFDVSRNIQACIESMVERKTFGAIIAFDFQKSFDSKSHVHIMNAIK
ncbi:NELlike 1 (Silurana), partial [Caligus rogercresseyi]